MPAAACKHTDTMIVRRGTMHDDYFWNFCDVIHDSHVHDDMYVLKLLGYYVCLHCTMHCMLYD